MSDFSIRQLIKPLYIFLTIVTMPVIATTTPSHVLQATNNLTSSVEKIRQHLNITTEARKPGVQIAKTPVHAYTKALEVFEKVIRFKQLKGWPVSKLPNLPSKKITPDNVLQLVQKIANELDYINKKIGIKFTPEAKFFAGKTPSDVYESLWRTSYLLDGLVGEISPTYVYRNAVRIEKSLIAIAQTLGKKPQISEPEKVQGKKPIDANIEGFKILYQLINIEKKLQLPPVRISSFPAGKIFPSDVYDTTNNIIAELTRINIKLSLPSVPEIRLSSEKITPNEVVFQFKKIQLLLNQISS